MKKEENPHQISLIIKEKYLKEIVSGSKKEEYRDVTDRLLKQVAYLDEEGNATSLKPIKSLLLYAGYQKDRKFAEVEVIDIELDNYVDDDGNPNEDDEFFVFILGKVISTNIS